MKIVTRQFRREFNTIFEEATYPPKWAHFRNFQLPYTKMKVFSILDYQIRANDCFVYISGALVPNRHPIQEEHGCFTEIPFHNEIKMIG